MRLLEKTEIVTFKAQMERRSLDNYTRALFLAESVLKAHGEDKAARQICNLLEDVFFTLREDDMHPDD